LKKIAAEAVVFSLTPVNYPVEGYLVKKSWLQVQFVASQR